MMLFRAPIGMSGDLSSILSVQSVRCALPILASSLTMPDHNVGIQRCEWSPGEVPVPGAFNSGDPAQVGCLCPSRCIRLSTVGVVPR